MEKRRRNLGFSLTGVIAMMAAMKPVVFGLTAMLVFLAPRVSAVDYEKDIKPIFAENCYRCHGASQQKSGLRLDTAAFAKKGGEHGAAITVGDARQSLMVQTLRGTHADLAQMPYKKPPLDEARIALIERWIDSGAIAPADEAPESNVHWSFIAPKRPVLPRVSDSKWPRNDIDSFILARLEKESIAPSPEADQVTLIRRASLDLIGLPPTPAEVDTFVNDPRPDAYERLILHLLASAHYGERWGRVWLDVARYADSNGYSIDAPRSIWKYRDWVIAALNRDLPYNEFIIEQLAGDLLPKATLEQKIATGFHRNTQINQEGGIDPEQFRVESIIDRVNTTATTFLGLTVGCAQCHDHKFDPITQREYYQFFAFFNNTVQDGHGKSAPDGLLEIPGEAEPSDQVEKELQEVEGDLNRFLDGRGSELLKWEQSLTPEQIARFKPQARKALEISFPQRTLQQKRALYLMFKGDDPEFKSRHTKLARLEKKEAKPVTTLVMNELSKPRESVVFIKGDFTRPGAKVLPGFLQVLPSTTDAPSNRLDLAGWIASAENPLTARVIVNRVWQQYFGKGLVETENDFGTQGAPPSHPELLDWLACDFIAHGWSLKHLHFLIATSSTYRQSSRVRPDLATIDPNNKLLARQSRLRLDAELVRDTCLQATGLLNPKIGGPSVFPPQPAGVMTLGQVKRDWKPSTGADRYRRGLYTHFWRATPHPALAVFDAPDAFSACTRRIRSNTPLQALTLLNDEAFYEFATALAQRLSRTGANDEARIDMAFRLCLARPPSAGERNRLLELLGEERASDPSQAWTSVARVVLNLDEMITRE